MKLARFYDLFHKKNNYYTKIIGNRNFTYFYTLQFLQEPCIKQIVRGKVLDVGCGVGTLALYLAKKGALVLGVDVSPRAIEIANYAKQANQLKQVVFKAGELQLGKPYFDLVICSEVIEHIADDQSFLRIINSNLKANGILYLSTPTSNNFLYKLGFYQKFDREVGHLRRYTIQSLTELLTDSGFKIIKLRQIEGPLRNILFTTRLGFMIKFIKGPLINWFHLVDYWSGCLFGFSNIMLLATKE
jgi:SAM-dependent methyltransferase